MLRAEKLTYRIGQRDLIKQITMELFPGKIYGVLGPNGSGKSTLLKCLAGIWQPTSGQVYWQDQLLHNQSRQQISQTIALVPQSVPILFDFTVEELVAMGRFPHTKGLDEPNGRQRVENALEMVDAGHLRHCLVNQLSHGERQRVYIARALITESPVLLLDEPTASLDIGHQLEIWKLLVELRRADRLIVIALHDLRTCAQVSDEVFLLHGGSCISHGTPDACLTPERLRHVFGVEAYQATQLCYRLPG